MNQSNKKYSGSLILAGMFLTGITGMILTGNMSEAGIPMIFFFLFLLVGIRGFPALKGFAFTVWVLAAAALAMFYPEYMVRIGDFDTERLIVPLIQIIMFGMGTAMSLQDFAGVVKMPRGVLVGLSCQFTIMPVIGITLALLMGFPAEIAAGIVLIGSSPSGVSSNVMAFISNGNLALSVTLTAFATLLAPLMTPFLMQLLAGQMVPIEFYSMMISILKMIILPVIAGLVFNRLFRGRVKWLHDLMPVVAMAANVVIIAVIVAAGRDSLLSIGLLLLIAAAIHNAAGYFLGYWGCRLFRMNKMDSRTIAFEVGMQNGGMAAGIASDMGRAATMGLFPAVFGTWMDISGSILANWWRDRQPDNEKEVIPPVEINMAVENRSN
ncbi:MAG: bile acid:sodium symporter family protein [Balneolaceae bacterium]